MAEVQSANPAPEAPAAEAVDTSFDDKLAAKLGLDLDPPKEAAEATPEGELAPDDIEPATEETSGEEFEFTHNGQTKRVPKGEALELLSKGYDYTTKTMALAQEKAATEQLKAAIIQRGQLTPQVVDAAATLKQYQQALQQYNNVDWATWYQQDPIACSGADMQMRRLKDGFQQAVGQFQQAAAAVQQTEAVISQAELQTQFGKVFDAAPELKEPEKFKAETGRIRGYLKEMGISDQEANSLYDARHLLIVRDAMRYRQAVKAKAERQTSTPTLRPGAAPQRQTAATQTAELTRQLHRAKDPAAKKELFDKLLERKVARFG